jgi:Mn-dependent DtxR family transcriptional regulator
LEAIQFSAGAGSELPYLRLSPTLENSIKAIVKLDPHGYGTKCVEIAESLGITKPSVTRIIKHLLEKGLIQRKGNLEIVLTSEGQMQAKHLVSRYDIIRRFLIEELGVDAHAATQDACNMEHILSYESLISIYRALEAKHAGEKT